MTTLVTPGDRLLTAGGRASWLKRPSTPFSSYAGGGSVPLLGAAGVSFTQLFRTQPWVAIAVNKLARQISRLPLKAYQVDSQGARERVREGALPDLLGKPWERGSASSLKQALSFPTLLHGNSLLWKDRPAPGASPRSFVPLDWRFLTPHTDDSGCVLFWETQQTGVSRFLPVEDVIHTSWWSPEGDIGVSPLQQLGVTLRLEDAAQRYSTASFDNAVRPSGALVAPAEAKMDASERAELREEVKGIHGGVDNAFSLMLLTGGVDFKPFSQTAKEAELIEARKLNREEVAAVYDIPPPLIGILDHATYSNVAEMHKMLYATVLGPWLDLIQETLQAQLVDSEPAFEGMFCEFDLNEVLKGDPEKRIPALKEGIGTGLYTINEARKMENLPRIEDEMADLPLIPTNNLTPLGAPVEEAPEPTPDGIAPMLSSHLRRARDRVLTKKGDFDPDRFQRELAADSGDPDLASMWAQTLTRGVDASAGDPDLIKTFFRHLGY